MTSLSGMQMATLRRTDVFSVLDEQSLQSLADIGSVVRKKRSEILFNSGDLPDGLYVVLDGELGVYANGRDGNVLMLNVLRRGSVIGDIAVMDGKERTATVRAHTKAELFLVLRDDFLRYLEQFPRVCLRFATVLAERCRYVSSNMETMFLLNGVQRVAMALLSMASNGTPFDGGRRIREPINQSSLAMRLGLTREYVNKTMRAFASEGLIDYDAGYVTVLNEDGLRGVVDGVAARKDGPSPLQG